MANAHHPFLFIISEPVGSPLANEVAYRLADHGVRTWIGSLAPAGELSDTAMDALRASVAALLIFDPAAAGSQHVERHLLVARQIGKPLIPLRVQPADEGLLRNELAGVRWIDWAAPDAAAEEIRRLAYEYDAAASQPAGEPPASAPIPAEPPRGPRIEVLQVAPAAAAAANAPPLGASERPVPAAAYEAPRRRSRLASPTLLLALLAAAVIAGLLLYNSALFRGDGAPSDREVAAAPTPAEAANADLYAEAAPAPVVEPGADAPPAEPPLQPPAEQPPAPGQPTSSDPAAPAAADAPPPAEATPERQPTPAPEAAAQGTSAVATVRSFYSALSGGNGAAAAQLVIPGKRQSGPLSAGALTRYFSSFRRPLRVRRVAPVDANTVRVAYDYVLSDGRLCEGEATVDLVQSGERRLVSGIRTRGPC